MNANFGNSRLGFGGWTALALMLGVTPLAVATDNRPNIVIMLADDLGYGELQCLNPRRGKIPTPRLDAIAASGMVFTDAHSGSSVCTPTRYGIVTGRYAWRTRLQSGVLTGGESLIAEDRLTLPELLRRHGYKTAVIGKWHLGMLFDGKENNESNIPVGTRVTHGPLDRGHFDEFHGFHHSRQIDVWIDNETVTEHIQPIDVLPRLAREAVSFVDKTKGNDQPFFLYVPWNSPHSPVVPSPEWQGESGLNAHADFVMQTDHGFGQVVDALRAAGKLENTLIICSSDNGTSAPTSKMAELQAMGHFPSGDLRGSKADIWDGGHRVPFLVSWPGVVKPGSRSAQLVCLSDIMATLADIIDSELPANAAEDSFSFLPSLLGRPAARTAIVHHSASGYFALREGDWKLSLCPRSGGWTGIRPSQESWRNAAAAGLPLIQLVNIEDDLGERNNLADEFPERAKSMRDRLDQTVNSGHSAPGKQGVNDVPVVVAKQPTQ